MTNNERNTPVDMLVLRDLVDKAIDARIRNRIEDALKYVGMLALASGRMYGALNDKARERQRVRNMKNRIKRGEQ